MKTITVTFYKHGATLATATGCFPIIPGEARLEWKGKAALEAELIAPYSAPLPDTHFAESFERAFSAMADKCNLHHTVNTSGEWESFLE